MRTAAVACLVLTLAAGCGAAAPVAVSSEPMEGAELGEALRGGGYVLFLRHGISDSAHDQGAPPQVTDCGRQRNLSSAGREQSERIGQGMRDAEVAIGEVLASPFCRTVQTAELAFGTVTEDDRLLQGDSAVSAETLREMLSEPPRRGNTILVGHVGNIGAAADLHIEEGETAVFAPLDDGDFALVATVKADEWRDLDPPD